ncbi:hypothetical protein ACFY94_25680 [Streptomyces griseorubiginosus]|uniref:hypothetical protein n=1 Tax=Streptomyces griseorubiginosus TaxID=67304 RepID=UPI0036E4CF50
MTGNCITNQGFSVDPKGGTWTALPNADRATYRGGGDGLLRGRWRRHAGDPRNDRGGAAGLRPGRVERRQLVERERAAADSSPARARR